MKKRMLSKINLFATLIASSVFGLQPNFVRTTTYNVDGAGNNTVATEYSDGLWRRIQTKLKLSDIADRVSCVYYDEVGRPNISTKSFVDNLRPFEYLPGEMSDAEIKTQIEASNLGDPCAYSVTRYWDDPLGRVAAALGPGDAYKLDSVKTWTFGVGTTDLDFVFTLGATYHPYFSAGFITAATSITEDMLDGLTQYMLANITFTNPRYILTVTKKANNIYSQELKDLFGRTLKTRDSVTVSGQLILPEYRFDILGNVLSENPPVVNGNPVDATQYQYNTLGQLIWKKTPDGGQFAYAYRPDGQIDYSVSFTGTMSSPTIIKNIHYLYDNFGRVYFVYQMVGASPPHQDDLIYYYYDTTSSFAGRSVFNCIPDYCLARLANLTGRLVGTIMVNGDSKKTDVGELYSYDDEGRINIKFTAINGSPIFQETDYSYDIHGKMIAEYFYYNGDHIKKSFKFDEQGRLAAIYHGVLLPSKSYNETELAHYHYDDLGQMDKKLFSATSSATYELGYYYDIRDRLSAITSPSKKKGVAEILQYDKVGNISNADYYYTFVIIA